MKKIVLLFFLLSLGLSVFCSPVSIQTAQRAAESYWAQMGGGKVLFVGSQTEFTEFYVFNNQMGGGFVLVSADDIAHPILGYSDKGSFRTDVQLPVNVRGWFMGISKEISSAVALGVQQSDEVREEWNSLLEGTPYPKRSTRAVNALLRTTWDQGDPYNNLCPADANDIYYGGRTVTGCVATAMAQVMKYWNYPTHGNGSHSYTHSTYGTQSANFGNTTYDWANMKNSYSGSSTAAQKTAVATLMYHCGVAVEMDYDIAENSGSGAYTISYDGYFQYCAQTALVNFFKYKSTIRGLTKGSYSDTEWKNLLKADLDAGRPIMYSGSGATAQDGGHSFVCDGYNNSDQFHFNWGWSGSHDGFFALNAMTPGSGGTGGGNYNYSYEQDAIIGIEPAGITVDPATVEFTSEGGSTSVTVRAGTASSSWSATCSANWLTFTPTTGAGSEATTTMTITASENNSTSTRNATITITQGSQTATLTVIQTDAATEACFITNEDIMSDDSTATTGMASNISFSYYKQIAEKVNVTGNYTIDKITFADMLNTATSGSIAIKIWGATTNGAPNSSEIYSANVNMSTINNAITPGQLQGGGTCYYGAYEYTLPSPIVVSGPFFVGVDFTGVGAGNGQGMSNVVCIADNQNHNLENTAYINRVSGGWILVSSLSGIDEAKFAIQAHVCPTDEQPNSLTVSPSSLSYTAEGESKTVTVTSNTSWTATSSANWLTVSPASGSNDGTFTAVAAANTTTSQRTATITVSGTGVSAQTISVTQIGEGQTGECVLYNETIMSDDSTGTTGLASNIYFSTYFKQLAEKVNVTGNYTLDKITFADMLNTATSGNIAIKVWSASAGTPNAELYSANINMSTINNALTTGQLTSGSTCYYGAYEYTLPSPIVVSGPFFVGVDFTGVGAGSSQGMSNVVCIADNQNHNLENTAYINSISNGHTGWYLVSNFFSGISEAKFAIQAHICPTDEQPIILSVSPSTLSYTAAGESKTVTVTSNTSWTATSSASWLTVNPASGSNDGTITAVAAANTTTSQRTATITISGTGANSQTISVTQAVESSGGDAVSTFTYDFEACTAWAVDQFSPCTTYDGDGSTTYIIQGSTFENQGYTGAYIAFENGITSNFTAHGGTKFGCCMAATVAPNNDWFITPAISISNGTTFSFWARSANNSYGLEQFKVAISTNNTTFTTYLAGSSSTSVSAPVEWTQYTYDLSQYAGQTMYIAIMCVSNDVFAFFIDDIVVSQPTPSYTLSVSPSSLIYTAAGESQTINVTSNTSWTVASSASWLTISPAAGSNNGTFTAVAAANTSTSQRTATITVSGTGVTAQTISVTQNGAAAIDEEVAESISVYPNPTNGMFTVGLGTIEGKATCQIVNINGSIIETREVNADSNSEIVFDCNVNSGVYFVRIISGNNVWTKRVVIEK